MSEESRSRWMRVVVCGSSAVGLLLVLGFLLPILWETSHRRRPQREGQAVVWLQNAARACNMYREDFGEFPPAKDATELARMLSTKTEHGPYMIFREKTPEKAALDPWGTSFLYERSPDRRSFRLGSAGPDGKFGTDDDIFVGNLKDAANPAEDTF